MKLSLRLCTAAAASAWLMATAHATERSFTYTYEPETMPKGGLEYEQWVTLQAGKDSQVGQENYNKWLFRNELEYGLTDNYTLSLYLNYSVASYSDPTSGQHFSDLSFDGVSLENKYLLLNPAEHAVGLALYLEPSISGSTAELEEKIILGQRHGQWKWAVNLSQATEWGDDFRQTEGELELSLGLTHELGKRWSLGLEALDNNEIPGYSTWENTAVYVGPVLSYREEKWWAALTVMPQVYGANFGGNPDGNPHLDLEGHERWYVRLIAGIGF
jgi:hypothetical protein